MKKPVLVVMAAGMGSRYGGLKQIDPVGNHGQLIIDYSIYDAKRAGFDTVVFVIKHEIEEAFHEAIGDRLSKFINVKYAYQQLDDLPEGYAGPGRPCEALGHLPRGACRAQDRGRPLRRHERGRLLRPGGLPRDISSTLTSHPDSEGCYEFAMVGYLLGNTVTEYGHVARGVCEDGRGQLPRQASRSAPTSRRRATTPALPRTAATPGRSVPWQHDSLHEPLGLHSRAS